MYILARCCQTNAQMRGPVGKLSFYQILSEAQHNHLSCQLKLWAQLFVVFFSENISCSLFNTDRIADSVEPSTSEAGNLIIYENVSTVLLSVVASNSPVCQSTFNWFLDYVNPVYSLPVWSLLWCFCTTLPRDHLSIGVTHTFVLKFKEVAIFSAHPFISFQNLKTTTSYVPETFSLETPVRVHNTLCK